MAMDMARTMNHVARLSTGQSSDGENVGQLGTSAVPVTRMSTGQSSGGSVSGDEVGLHGESTAVRPISEVEEDDATGDGDGDTRVTAGASTIASTAPPPRTTTAMPRIVPVARQSTGLSSFSERWADDEAEEGKSLITGVAQQQAPASDSFAAAANRAGSDESTNSVFGEDMALQALVGGESAPAPTRGADAKGFRGTVRGMPVPRISTGLGSESCTDVDEPSTQPSVPEAGKATSTTSSSTTVATNANANTNADGRVEDATVQTHAREDRREDAARADNDVVVVVEQQPTPTRSHSSKHERDIAADLSLTTGQFLVKYRTNAVVGLSLAESRLRLKT